MNYSCLFLYINNITNTQLDQFIKLYTNSHSKSFNPDQTEWGNIVVNGYDRIWNYGNDAWVWQKQKHSIIH